MTPALRGGHPLSVQRLRSGDDIAYVITSGLRADHSGHHGTAGIRALQEFGLAARANSAGSFSSPRLGIPVAGRVRGAAVHLWHGGDVLAGAIHGNPAGRRRGDLSGRARPRQDFGRADLPDRVAGGRSQRDFRVAGNLCFGARSDRLGTGDPGGSGMDASVPGTVLWRQPVFGRRGAVDHDRAVHHFHFAGSDPGGPQRTARRGAGAGRHQLGNHLGCRGSLRAEGHHGLDFPGAGALSGRNHGRDHGDRQRAQDPCFACLRPATRSPR